MRALPIRLRLTLLYFVLFVTAAAILSMASWWMLRRTVDATIRQDLQERIDDVRIQLQSAGPHPALSELQEQFAKTYRNRDDGKWLQILDQDHQWIFRSFRMASARIDPLQSGAPSDRASVTEFVEGPHPVRLYSISLLVSGREYIVQTGMSLNKSRALIHDFGAGLFLLTPLVVLLAAAGGHLMSRKALEPVNRIAYEARRISDKNLDTRLPVSETEDELSFLSSTLNGMLARIDEGFRSTKDFTANASHELRTPLARIRAEAEIALLRPRQANEYRETLQNLHQSAIDMTILVDNLLALARVEAGTESSRMSHLNLGTMLEEWKQEWHPIAQQLSIGMRFGMAPPLQDTEKLWVLADRLSLTRLMRILLDNACKFTPAGGTITIDVHAVSDRVTLAVQDSGIGIAPEYHRQIFERFYRVQYDRSPIRPGAGLGLALARCIAMQHGGDIEVTSEPDLGSRFQFTLHRVVPPELKSQDSPDWGATDESGSRSEMANLASENG